MSTQLCQEAAGEFQADNRVERHQELAETSMHEHQFTPVWQSDGTLIDWCSCGQERECNVSVLEKFLQACISAKNDYLRERDKSKSATQKQKFTQAAADKDKQIAWLKEQIERRSPGNSSSDSAVSYLALDEIRRDGGTQPRAAIDLKHVKLLEEQIEDGKELEPVIVFYDGESYWLADGFHRYAAHKNQDKEAITCFIHQGTRREAVLYSVGANADNKPALPRSREDKRRVVMTLLQDPEWGKWSDRVLARHCKVDHKTVGKIRGSVTGEFPSEKRTYKTKHGTTAAMNTANINKKPTAQVPQLLDNDSVATTREQELQHSTPEEVKYSSSNQDGLVIVNSITNQPLPQIVEVDTNDILVAFTSNIDYMSEAQLEAAVRAIAFARPDLIRRVLRVEERFAKGDTS